MRIGIVGTMMSGKTTLANILVDELGFERVALADAVKDDCVALLNRAIEDVNKAGVSGPGHRTLLTRQSLEDNKPVFRTLLQWYGTNFWRDHMEEPEHWLQRLRTEVETRDVIRLVLGSESLVVTDDVRFVNEAEFLREQLGYHIIRIVRPEGVRQKLLQKRYPDPEQLAVVLSHPSETQVPDIRVDKTIDNVFPTERELAEWVRQEFMEWISA